MMTNVNGDSSGEKVLDVSVNPFCWALVCPCSFGAIPYSKLLLRQCPLHYIDRLSHLFVEGETLILGHDELTVIET
jgi:hypothetical protein